MNRIRFFAVLLAVLVVSSPVLAEETRTDEEILREIKEVLWPLAYAEQDVELLGTILADEFQMVDAEGNWSDRAGELAWVKINKPGYDSLAFVMKRLDIFENGTAVIGGTGVVSGHTEKGPYNLEFQSTNVMIKRDGRWQAIASHVSGIKKK